MLKQLNESIKQCKNVLFDWNDVEVHRNKNFDSNARLNIITEQQDDISEAVSTMLSQYNVEVFSFENKNNLKKSLVTYNYRVI